jgi:lipopolysaccharide transport system permease protein
MPNQIESTEQDWDLIIEPKAKWFELHLDDLWRYRDLVYMFVKRDFVTQFKQTILGPAWFVIQPLLTTLVFTLVFGNIAKLSTDGLPKILFYMSGNVVWMYFSNVLTATSNTFMGNQHLFGKVYFPRLTMPISVTISHLMKFGVQVLFFLCFWIYYFLLGSEITLHPILALFPVLVVIMAMQSLGLGILFSSFTTKYRDLKFLLDFGVRLLMYASPVIYPLSSIPDKWRWVIWLNPMTHVIEAFRLGFLGVGSFSWWGLAYSSGAAILFMLIGTMIFNHIERTFMDTV